MKSSYQFNRWICREDSTWAYLVFQKHNSELTNILLSHLAASDFTYSTLGKSFGANYSDDYHKWFKGIKEVKYTPFEKVQDWSDSFNKFKNWTNLNCVVAMSANLETYMSTVISLALESDVGVLYGASQKIDGLLILKYGKKQPTDFKEHLIGCTKGDWNSRIRYFERIFGSTPLVLSNNVADLEALRILRNNIGHAFGRDINESRNHEIIEISKMASLKTEKLIHFTRLIYKIAKDIDKQLFFNNIGAYQDLCFYHRLRGSLTFNDFNKKRQFGNHVSILKNKLGQHAAKTSGIEYCKGLINYYETM